MIETAALAELMKVERVKLVHAVHLPGKPEEARDSYIARHLPGYLLNLYSATLFNPDVIRDRSKPYPFMMPLGSTFIEYVKAANLQRGDRIVCYDERGVFIAPRVWWMLRAMGAQNVAVLNGGLPKWEAEGRDIESGELEYEEYQKGDFDYKLNEEMYYRFEDIKEWEENGRTSFNLIEARPGVEAPGKHIKGVTMMPFPSFQSTQHGYTTMKPKQEIKALF